MSGATEYVCDLRRPQRLDHRHRNVEHGGHHHLDQRNMPDTPAGMPATPPFPPTDLSIAPQGIVAPYTPTYTDGITTVYAQVAVLGLPSPAPEPSTIAVFGLALAGWAYRRRSRARA